MKIYFSNHTSAYKQARRVMKKKTQKEGLKRHDENILDVQTTANACWHMHRSRRDLPYSCTSDLIGKQLTHANC